MSGIDSGGLHIEQRMSGLRLKAAARYKIRPQDCHVGHVVLEAMLQNPTSLNQIDGATDTSETNQSVATRTMRLANAMSQCGLVPGDAVVIMGPNHLDVAVPYYACHFGGFSMCSIDPSAVQEDLRVLYKNVMPKMIFCQKACVEKNQLSLDANNLQSIIVTFDDKSNDLELFVKKYNGTDDKYRPAVFDTSKIAAWLMLTSGTTGVPKVAIMTFDAVYNGMIQWWGIITDPVGITLTMTSTQWLSSLIFYLSTPLKPFTRLQSSAPLTPPLMMSLINKYKPNATAWTPFLLAQFVLAAGNVCDLSCFQHILVGGSAMEKPILDQFKLKCKARLYLVYGMTELLVPVFDYKEEETPFGASGKPLPQYEYKFINEEDGVIEECKDSGELWIKGDAFFKGYLNNPEETEKILTKDGWFKTGDIFRKDENNFYYFVERKKLLIRYLVHWVSPLQLEEVIKKHPGVAEACVVGIPDPQTMERAVGVIKKRNGANIDPQEIFDLLKGALPEMRQLHGGLYFVDSFPQTASGKINRSKVAEQARTAERLMPK